jgi:hypothetical protein
MRSRHFGRQGSPIWQPYLYWHPTVCVCVCLLCVLLIRLIAPARLDMLDWATDKTVKRLTHTQDTHTKRASLLFFWRGGRGGNFFFFPVTTLRITCTTPKVVGLSAHLYARSNGLTSCRCVVVSRDTFALIRILSFPFFRSIRTLRRTRRNSWPKTQAWPFFKSTTGECQNFILFLFFFFFFTAERELAVRITAKDEMVEFFYFEKWMLINDTIDGDWSFGWGGRRLRLRRPRLSMGTSLAVTHHSCALWHFDISPRCVSRCLISFRDKIK